MFFLHYVINYKRYECALVGVQKSCVHLHLTVSLTKNLYVIDENCLHPDIQLPYLVLEF